MFGLLISGLLPVQTDLRIALAVGHTSHSQIHTNLATFAIKVGTQAFNDLLVYTLSHTDYMLGSPIHLAFLFSELGTSHATLGAFLWRDISLMDITADRTNPFLHNKLLFIFLINAFQRC